MKKQQGNCKETVIMANKKPSKSFKKDDPRINLDGRPPTSPEEKELRKVTKENIIKKFDELFYLPIDKIKEKMNHPNTNALTAYLCNCILIGKATGNYGTIELMFNRIIGKVKDSIEVGGENGQPISVVITKNYIENKSNS